MTTKVRIQTSAKKSNVFQSNFKQGFLMIYHCRSVLNRGFIIVGFPLYQLAIDGELSDVWSV